MGRTEREREREREIHSETSQGILRFSSFPGQLNEMFRIRFSLGQRKGAHGGWTKFGNFWWARRFFHLAGLLFFAYRGASHAMDPTVSIGAWGAKIVVCPVPASRVQLPRTDSPQDQVLSAEKMAAP